MKKIFLFLFLTVPFLSLAYTSADISTANFLADEGIIVQQSVESKYRLDDTITRAEVIGMALKIQWVTLPDGYFCKNYFTDVRYNAKNNWVCRAIEIAADKEIISKANTRARPQDSITRAEALAIIMKAGGIDVQMYTEWALMDNAWIWDENLTRQVTTPWQLDIFYSYFKEVSDTYLSGTQFARSDSNSTVIKWIRPNVSATRAEVFGFAGSVLGYEAPEKNDSIVIENNNIVWYQNGENRKVLTTDGNDVLWSDGTCESPAKFNQYKILGQVNRFFVVSHAVGLCETDSSHEDILIFDGKSLVNLRTKILQEFQISLGYGITGFISVKNNQILLSGSFSYDDSCVDLGCPVYLSREMVKSLDIRVLKEPKGSVSGEFEFYFDPVILF